jgi:hypothetical protein
MEWRCDTNEIWDSDDHSGRRRKTLVSSGEKAKASPKAVLTEVYQRANRLSMEYGLLELAEHGVGTDLEWPGRIAYPTGIETHVDEELLDLG